jgi:DNA-binding CsgD family transcriptional regulator
LEYLFSFIGVGFLSYQLHLKRLKIKQNQIREKLEKKLERQAEINSAEIIQLRNEQLEKSIISKSEELANSTMAVIKKNELLLTIKKGLSKIKTEPETRSSATHFNQVLHLVDSNISTEQDWQVFENNFNQVHEEFIKKLLMNHPNLTPSDVKLAAYLRMNLTTKEIAHLLNITNRSVELKRYRLRKKMNINTEVNLGEFMMAY